MKGMYARFQQRQAKKIFPAAMEVYAETLNHLTQASGGGGVLRQDDRPLNIRLKPNEVHAVRALDRPDYYRTVMIKKKPDERSVPDAHLKSCLRHYATRN